MSQRVTNFALVDLGLDNFLLKEEKVTLSKAVPLALRIAQVNAANNAGRDLV